MLQLAKRADAGGIDSLWLTEDPDGWDAFALLGAISQQTERIQLGTAVTNPYLRHPNLIAASVATIDRLAPERVVLGLGRGQPEWYEHGLGMNIGSSLARLEETIALLHQWWEPDAVASIDGEFHIRSWKRRISPATTPPIYLAAAGPRALDLAARAADGVIFNMLATPAYTRKAIARVRAAAVSAGRNPDSLRFIANPGILITDDPAPVLAGLKRFVANVLTLPGMDALLENPDVDVDAIMQRVRAHMQIDELLAKGGAFADFAEHGNLDAAVAEIPDALVIPGSAVGTIPEVRERIRAFAEIGLTDLMIARKGLPPTANGIRALLAELRA